MKSLAPEVDIYGAFLKDVKASRNEILPPSLLNDLIEVTRTSTLSPASRATARTEVHASMERLIPFAIARFAPPQIPPEELVGEAYLTIDACINAFDPNKGVKFSSYALSALRTNLRTPRTITDLNQPFYMPEDDRQYSNQIKRSYTEAAQKAEGEPTLAQWYQQTEQDRKEKGKPNEISIDTFRHIHSHTVRRPYLRLVKPISSGNIHPDSLNTMEGRVEELISDDSIESNPELDLINKEAVEIALSQLPARTRFIVEKQIDLLDEHITQEALADEFDVSKGRIGQILQDGLYLLKLHFGNQPKTLEAAKKRRSLPSKQS